MSGRKLPAWMNQSSAKTTTSSTTNKENSLPKLTFPGQTTYTYNKSECNFICNQLLECSKTQQIVLGFDIEWKVTYTTGEYRPTSVLQLCEGNKHCNVFHLIHINGFPSELRRLLEDEAVLKVGVGICGDIDRLKVDFGVVVKGVVDLSEMANRVLRVSENWSLNGLLMNQFQMQILKTSSVRCSDWEAVPLSEVQIQYAVLDAYAGVLIYQKLLEKDSR